MWYQIFAETIPAPNWTGLLTGGCLGSFVTAVALTALAVYLSVKDEQKSGGIPFEEIAILDGGNGQQPN